MASSIVAAPLTVTVSTSISIGGQTRVTENQLVVENVNEYDNRIMSIPTASEVTVVAFGTAVAAGTFIRGDMRFLSITNKDTVNYARIRMKKNGADTFDTKLDAGGCFMLCNAKESVSATAAAFSAFQDADSVSAQAYGDAVDIEYVVGSI